MTARTISNWERGRGSPRGDQRELCEKWGKITGVDAGWLMSGKRT